MESKYQDSNGLSEKLPKDKTFDTYPFISTCRNNNRRPSLPISIIAPDYSHSLSDTLVKRLANDGSFGEDIDKIGEQKEFSIGSNDPLETLIPVDNKVPIADSLCDSGLQKRIVLRKVCKICSYQDQESIKEFTQDKPFSKIENIEVIKLYSNRIKGDPELESELIISRL
ncbi:MAG: hypothetical protein PG980_001003 [Wolbachia endosymbiont of Ctenocephalides felis wCfeJ]|nr:MAG: hypothetical protein PG980_001003 [Wolbachia endosymbiont of Ctenocephalides felis wCfeJ]